MYTLINSLIGIAFVVLAAVLTFLMFHIWRYPFDQDRLRVSAPPWMITTHRLLGALYVLIYIFLMWQMVPRLWSYQIELPPRTVMHLTLGMGIGAILITKIAIVRFFKHMEAKLVPFLGSLLFILSCMLIFLALPFSFREVYLSKTALGGETLTAERIERVREQLPKAGVKDPKLLSQLASAEGLEQGRLILTTKCVQCHDLRTVLARPRTPEAWQQTVSRMANRSTILNPITETDQLHVMAYLVAISPTLQETLKQKRQLQMESENSRISITDVAKSMSKPDTAYEPEKARAIFESTCSQCHSYKQVENAAPATPEEVVALVQRMVGNGLTASQEDLDQVIRYLTETYARGTSSLLQSRDEPEFPEKVDGSTDAIAATTDGESLFSEKLCVTCHGPQGRSPIGTTLPKLAGQNKEYLVQQIKDIKSGARNNAFTSQMVPIVANLNNEEIEALADYLAKLEC